MMLVVLCDSTRKGKFKLMEFDNRKLFYSTFSSLLKNILKMKTVKFLLRTFYGDLEKVTLSNSCNVQITFRYGFPGKNNCIFAVNFYLL